MEGRDIPKDIVMDILSRLPLEQSGKARELSKFYAKETHRSYYKELLVQRQRGPILDGSLFQTLRAGSRYGISFASPLLTEPFNISLNFLPGRRPKILAAAPNGILLCETIHLNRPKDAPIYSIVKPTTKQFKGIPLPRTRFYTRNIALFVFRSNPLHFKIVRMSENQRPKHPPIHAVDVCEVFDSESWRWKRLADVVKDDESKHLQCHNAAVVASGSAHWKSSDEVSISAFDFYSESWSRIQMPQPITTEYENYVQKLTTYNFEGDFVTWQTKIVAYEGKLGLMWQFRGSTELWVMENYTARIWSKKSNVSLGSTLPSVLYGSNISMTWPSDVMVSNSDTGECKKLKLDDGCCRTMVFPWMSDFEAWNFNAPPRTIGTRAMIKIVRKRLREINNDVDVLSSFFYFFISYNVANLTSAFYFLARRSCS